MCEVGKPPRRSKAATLTTLKRDLGKEKIGHLDRQQLIDYGKMRAEQGAGPVTLGIDIGVIKMIITHAAAVHGLDISPEPVDLACVASLSKRPFASTNIREQVCSAEVGRVRRVIFESSPNCSLQGFWHRALARFPNSLDLSVYTVQ